MRAGSIVISPALLALLLSPALAQADAPHFVPEWPVTLQSEVIRVTRGFEGEAMFFVKDLQSGVRYAHNAATPTYIASGVKLVFMVGLFRLIADGEASLDEELTYESSDVRDGAPVFNYLKVGTKIPLRVVLEAMVHQSDNAASDMIARRVGMDTINRTLIEEGITGFGPLTSLLDVRRLVYRLLDPRVDRLSPQDMRAIGFARTTEDRVIRLTDALGELPGTYTIPDVDRAFREYYRTGYNSATMEAVGTVLERIATGQLISPEASQAMIEVLLGTITGADRIKGKLPPGVQVAHKTGTQYQRICDFGIIYPEPDRPVVFAACTKGGGKRRAEEVISTVARKAYDALLAERAITPMEIRTSTSGKSEARAQSSAKNRKKDKKKPRERAERTER